MASSSSHTSSLSSSGSSSSPDFSGLPIHLLRGKIIQKIQENRVTLIVGETGCGKSSQVPQFLLEENMEPILCTQPRRFAVVAVARMVAKARNCEVGGEVGYHIGHSKVLSDRSKIVFKTAGVLLDEMREKGLKALKYKVIILDEVHERSVESDLVLVCVKQFLVKQNDMRVLLMSATADIARYREYFKDLGKDERVEVLAIPSSPQHTIYQQKVSYLGQITELLGMSSQSLALKYCSGPRPSLAKAEMKPEVHELIHELVLHIHKNEPDMEKSILVFLPTYQSLVHQWASLKRFVTAFKIHILHSSIDIEQALKAMKISESHRKVILATNIAESSVTIPKVAYVIDSCRSLQVFWDHKRKNDASDIVWISKSQADQRKGRTGRTCDGHVYRLVTGSFFNQLQVYESPAILRLSLTQQVLLLCCSESKAISDPKVLLQKALDAPDLQVVEDALSLLVRVRALEKISPRGRYEPTFYGRLLASFSLSFDASVLILKFGKLGMPREGILLGILMDTQPLPILRPFGQDDLFAEYNGSYYSGDCRKTGLTGRKEVSFMGNLSAFLFWQHVFKDKHRLERLKEIFKCDETEVTQIPPPKFEEEWCSSHNLVQSSLHHIAEIYENVLNTLHRFRPNILVTSGLPFNYDPYESQHTCILKCERNEDEDGDVLAIDDDEHPNQVGKIGKCIALPFVDNQIHLDEVAESLGNIIKEVRVQYIEDTAGSHQDLVKGYDDHESGEAPICRYFVSGMCNRGSQCTFSHSLQATKPVCKFFLSLRGCRNGDSCFFSHDAGSMPLSYSSSNFCLPEEFYADVSSLLHLFPAPSNGCILLLNDNGFQFTANLARLYDPASIICTTSLVDDPTSDSSLAGVRILTGLSHPYHTIFDGPGESSIPWNQVKCVLWFPTFEGFDGKRAVQTFFEHLAVRILADALYDIQVILTMNNIRFSQLQVEKLGRESFFVLRESFPYDESSFGPLPDAITVKKPMVVSKPVCYVFCLRPPTHINLGDYATVLRQRLRSIQ